jgi:hypothetical protein
MFCRKSNCCAADAPSAKLAAASLTHKVHEVSQSYVQVHPAELLLEYVPGRAPAMQAQHPQLAGDMLLLLLLHVSLSTLR